MNRKKGKNTISLMNEIVQDKDIPKKTKLQNQNTMVKLYLDMVPKFGSQESVAYQIY